MSHLVTIDSACCIGCGACAADCPATNIELKDGKAVVFAPAECLFCGHCEAICPQGAVALTGFEEQPREVDGPTRLDPDALLDAIRTRRSIRHFTEETVPEDVVGRIIGAG